MQEIIRVENQPAEVFVNFDEVKAQLQQHLQHYEKHVVTADTVADARKLAADLNALATSINKRSKDEVDRASVHINQFKEQMKELSGLCKEARGSITSQIAKFDAETKEKAQALLVEQRAELWEKQEVKDEFRSAAIDDLVKVASVTPGGKLTKSAATELTNRVHADAAKQHKIQLRLAQLDARSIEAGLAAPLTRDHVAHFLFNDDEAYERDLVRILDAEIDRQAQAEQRERDRAERDAKQKAEAEQKEAERQQRMKEAKAAEQAAPEPKPDPEPDPVRAPGATDKSTWYVVMTFEVEMPVGITLEEVKAGARSIVDQRALKTLKNVTAQKRQGVAA